jgi:hypothetical protein
VQRFWCSAGSCVGGLVGLSWAGCDVLGVLLCVLCSWALSVLNARNLVLMGLAHPTCPRLRVGLLLSIVVSQGSLHRFCVLCPILARSCCVLGRTLIWVGICRLLHPILLGSSGGCFSALWAVFWAPPSDAVDVCCVVVDTWCDLFAALVAVLLWCSRVVGHGVACWLVCWIICLVSVRAARWSTFHEHLTIVCVGCPIAPCMNLNVKVLLMVCWQPGHTSSG